MSLKQIQAEPRPDNWCDLMDISYALASDCDDIWIKYKDSW